MKSMRLLLVMFTFCAGLVTAQSTESVLKVKGEAILQVVPEQMNIHIPIQVKEPTYEACSDKLIRTYNELRNALVKNGIAKDEVRAGRLEIQENYVYTDRERKLEGYIGTINISLDLPHNDKKLTSIMNTMKAEKFSFGYNLSFSLSETQKKNLREEAIKTAIADAREKAAVIAEAMQVQLSGIREISHGYDSDNHDIMMQRGDMAYMKADYESAPELQLTPNKIEIRKTISIVWMLAQ